MTLAPTPRFAAIDSAALDFVRTNAAFDRQTEGGVAHARERALFTSDPTLSGTDIAKTALQDPSGLDIDAGEQALAAAASPGQNLSLTV